MLIRVYNDETQQMIHEAASIVRPMVGDWITICSSSAPKVDTIWVVQSVSYALWTDLKESGSAIAVYAKPATLNPDQRRGLFKVFSGDTEKKP